MAFRCAFRSGLLCCSHCCLTVPTGIDGQRGVVARWHVQVWSWSMQHAVNDRRNSSARTRASVPPDGAAELPRATLLKRPATQAAPSWRRGAAKRSRCATHENERVILAKSRLGGERRRSALAQEPLSMWIRQNTKDDVDDEKRWGMKAKNGYWHADTRRRQTRAHWDLTQTKAAQKNRSAVPTNSQECQQRAAKWHPELEEPRSSCSASPGCVILHQGKGSFVPHVHEHLEPSSQGGNRTFDFVPAVHECDV